MISLLLMLQACACGEESADASAGTGSAPEVTPDGRGIILDISGGEVTGRTDAPTSGSNETGPELPGDGIAVFRFAGDFTQAEEGGDGVAMSIMSVLDSTYGGDITRVFSDDLLSLMRDADVFMLNNEFTYTDRGTPTAGKHWTFRADPARVANLTRLGVDVVGLANNHAFDWGEVSLLDTIDVLDREGIPHVGAGADLAEAKKAAYFTVEGKVFSIVAATSVEKAGDSEFGMTRAATADAPGVLNTREPEETLDAIRTASENSDFCFVFVHWGTEMQEAPDAEQKELAALYVEAGADAVIGAHPHILQGIEYVGGKPVIYSMGNFWFNTKERETCLFEVAVDTATMEPRVFFHPCLQRDSRTVLVTDSARRAQIIDDEIARSFDITIDHITGEVTRK